MRIWWCEIELVGWAVPGGGEAYCAPRLPEEEPFHGDCGWRYLNKLLVGDHPAVPGEANVALYED